LAGIYLIVDEQDGISNLESTEYTGYSESSP
jgi:hypothetical protein